MDVKKFNKFVGNARKANETRGTSCRGSICQKACHCEPVRGLAAAIRFQNA